MDDTQLIKLASVVITKIKPNKNDRESVEDCWQIAYLAGLQALRNATSRRSKTSSRYLILCMQSAVYRALQRIRPETTDRLPDNNQHRNHEECRIDAIDFLQTHMTVLTKKQASTLIAFYSGVSVKEIAAREGVKYKAIHARMKTGLHKLKSIQG